jgi:hypothetical protein
VEERIIDVRATTSDKEKFEERKKRCKEYLKYVVDYSE